MFKKVYILVFAVIFSLIPFISHAAEAPKSMTLYKQSFDGLYLSYQFHDENGEIVRFSYLVPDSKLQQVRDSTDPTLEAKKVITAAYEIFSVTDRLKEVNNEYFSVYDITPSIDTNLKIRFENEKKEASSFAQQEKQAWDTLTKEQQSAMYDVQGDYLYAHDSIDTTKLTGDEEKDTQEQSSTEEPIAPSTTSGHPIFITIAIIVIVGSTVILVLKRKRR